METLVKTTWNIDTAHSEITFKVKHMMISTVTGHFDEFEATVETEDDNFTNAKIEFSAKTASINTKNKQRDSHLKSDDFFNAEEYPEIKFVAKSYENDKLIGDLTIRDVTKEVSLVTDFNGIAVDPYGATKAGFELNGKISRKDFNLTWNAVTEAGSVVVADDIKIIAHVQFVKQ